jgi:transcription elongation factor Elf1
MATVPASVPSCAPVARGFGPVCCPRCGEPNACVSVELGDFSAGDALHCKDCDESFSLDLIRNIVKTWPRVLAWLDSAPAIEE